MVMGNILESEVGSQKLIEFLEIFENNEAHETAVDRCSGGYANAEYDYTEDGTVYITLKWGIQNDVEDTLHTEHYTLEVADLISDKNSVALLDCIKDK